MNSKKNEFESHALLTYCIQNDNSNFIKNKIHQEYRPTRNWGLRKLLKLSYDNINFINKIGLIKVRNLVEKYIETLTIIYKKNRWINSSGIKEKFPIDTAILATGLCCRKCMEVCHKINLWKKILPVEKNKLINIIMKWIEINYNKQIKL